jgi:hypothetical protein
LICHTRANMLFCYDKRLLHLQIRLLFPLVLTPFWALFLPTLQRNPNGGGQMQRHLLLAHRRCFLLSFFIILHRCIYERPFSAYRIWLLLLTLSFVCWQEISCELIF